MDTLVEHIFLIEPNREYQKSFEYYASAYRKINDSHYFNKYKKALENFQEYIDDIHNCSNGYNFIKKQIK
jgi:predicted acetyltransferase